MRIPNLADKRGVTLLLAIIVVTLLFSAGLNLTFIATKELGFSRLTSDSVKAHYAAESALECAVYWMFKDDGIDYFSIGLGNDHDIYCNDETINVGGATESTIGLGVGSDQYGEVTVERLPDYSKKNFKLSSEGFNEGGAVGSNPGVVQQELGAVSIEECIFSPDDADAADNSFIPNNVLDPATLQNALDIAYPGEFTVNADNTNVYQTWRVGGNFRAKIFLEVLPLSAIAYNINTFGFYINSTDPVKQITNSQTVYNDSLFKPVFSNNSTKPGWGAYTNSWGVPELDQNDEASADWGDDDWEEFELEVEPNDVIAFAIDTQRTYPRGSYNSSYRLHSTERNLSTNPDQWAQTYSVPKVLWQNEEIPEFIIAFEDQSTSDPDASDYNDMTVVVRVKSCINTFQRY